MTSVAETLNEFGENTYPMQVPFLEYIRTGDEKPLPKWFPEGSLNSWLYRIIELLPKDAPWGDEYVRIFILVKKYNLFKEIGSSIDHAVYDGLSQSGPNENVVANFVDAFNKAGWSEEQQLTALTVWTDKYEDDGQPTSLGRHLLGLSEDSIRQHAELLAANYIVTGLFAKHRPERIALFDRWMMRRDMDSYAIRKQAGQLLSVDASKYEQAVADRINDYEKKDVLHAFDMTKMLYEKFPDRWRERMIEEAINETAARWPGYWCLGTSPWLVENAPRRAAEAINRLADTKPTWKFENGIGTLDRGLKLMVEQFTPEEMRPILTKFTAWDSVPLKLEVLDIFMKHPEFADDDFIAKTFERGLAGKPHKLLPKMVKLAARWNMQRMKPALWKAMAHKSKSVREAAARELAALGNDALEPAIKLLGDKKADTRASAAQMLGMLATPEARAAIEAHLDVEEAESPREAMFLALDTILKGAGRGVDKDEIRRRVERAKKRGIAPPAEWAKPETLPSLYYQDGEKLDADTVSYLLDRQSRCGAIRPDIEAKALYNLIDRTRSVEFAVAILNGFLAPHEMPREEYLKIGGTLLSRISATVSVSALNSEKWSLAIAGMLADDRLIPAMMQLIGTYTTVDTYLGAGRPQMAAYVAQAIGLIGSDAAVRTLDTLALRYRAKWKPVGIAAAQSLAEIAERRGLTIDELGDAAVPRLGFEPDQPYFIGEKEKFELRIDAAFKLAIIDPSKNKPVKSLPASAGEEARKSLKELQAELKEAAKGQTLRLENLMVRQYRWGAPRWRELFLDNPFMRPFAWRLVWGVYECGARNAECGFKTFRALEDLSLTDANDNSVELDSTASIGIVHPLEFSTDAREAWVKHLDAYEIGQPFTQLDRRIIALPDSWKDRRSLATHTGTEINNLTFKGRADRLGWGKGPIDDHDITFYYKSFPTQQCDFLLSLDGIAIDGETTGKIGAGYFVKSGAVKFGHSSYDNIESEEDERVMPLATVPPIVFSEIAGDLEKIGGTPCKFEEEGTKAEGE